MVDFAKLVRKAFEQQSLLSTISVRTLLAWGEKTEMCADLELGLKLTWYEKLTSDDKASARDMFHAVFARQIS